MSVLDNPAWSALCTTHSALAHGNDRARRYPVDVSMLAGMPTAEEAHLDALADLHAPGERALLFTAWPIPAHDAWDVRHDSQLGQMVLTHDLSDEAPDDLDGVIVLGEADLPAMLDLVKRTKPGPFLPGTPRMGRYVGYRDGEQLVAMAGERLRPHGLTEISAVCTDPEFLGRGLATRLVTWLCQEVLGRGELPLLHYSLENTRAQRVYRRLGFRDREGMRVTVLKRR